MRKQQSRKTHGQIGEAVDEQPDAQETGKKPGSIHQQAEGKEPESPEDLGDENSLLIDVYEEDRQGVALRFVEHRQELAADGMVVIVATVDGKTGKLIGAPDIISRGFIYMKDSKRLIDDTCTKIKQVLSAQSKQQLTDETYLKDKLRNDIGQFLFQKTERRPMILPVVITV